MSSISSFRRFLLLGQPAESTARSRGSRDARIDVVRGLALLIIFINHMPGNVVSAYMPHNFGFSDAADIFVLLAGVSATLAYGGLIEQRGFPVAALKLGGRLWTLYIAHIAVFIIVCGVVATAVTQTQNPLYIEAINIQPFFRDTVEALIGALTLTYQPSYLDILPLYIVLLALFPAIYYAVRISPLLTLAVSLAIWQAALAFELNLPNGNAGIWFFNPFAWQVVFTLGIIIGRAAQLGVGLPRLVWLDVVAVAFILFAWVVKTSAGNPTGIGALSDWVDSVQLGSDKTNLAWTRLMHVGALSWLAIRWLPAGGAMAKSALGRALACAGQNSLHVFCVGIVLSIIGQIVLAETSFALDVQLLICTAGVTVLTGLGIFLSWYRSITKRGASAEPTPARGAQAPRPSFSSR
ncbi:OpgC family protein [Bosea sp. NBC_00550]|uniref:OpgC family protein n=1 Tax=Bosea sp. NBC_00550 TaxID=2969621 RepID=UPI002231DFC1|nr:OpgC domain-containing protein [Bosea sp. NBC_00550]UZF94195.1 OpgC domain-containing protein [Bosea sp. NBC_00550]